MSHLQKLVLVLAVLLVFDVAVCLFFVAFTDGGSPVAIAVSTYLVGAAHMIYEYRVRQKRKR